MSPDSGRQALPPQARPGAHESLHALSQGRRVYLCAKCNDICQTDALRLRPVSRPSLGMQAPGRVAHARLRYRNEIVETVCMLGSRKMGPNQLILHVLLISRGKFPGRAFFFSR